MLWDARCSGIYVGFGMSAIYHLAYRRWAAALPPLPLTILTALMLAGLPLDVLTISLGWREPANDIRFLTGLFFGSSICVFLYPAFVRLTSKKTKAFSALPSLRAFIIHYLIIVAAIILLKWNNPFPYAILFALSVFGFLTLIFMLILGVYVWIAGSCNNVRQ